MNILLCSWNVSYQFDTLSTSSFLPHSPFLFKGEFPLVFCTIIEHPYLFRGTSMLRKWSVLFISSFTLIFLFQNCGQFESQNGLSSSSSSFNNFSSDEINPNAPLGVYAMDSSSIENREMVIELKLNKSDLSDINIQWETADGVAMSGKHYEASSGSAVIRAGQTSTDIRIPILRSEMATDVAFMVRVLSTSKGQIAKELATASIPAGSATPILANVWSPLNTNGAPSGRGGHSAVWTGSKMIVFGGYNGSGGFQELGDGGIYDPATGLWSSLNTNGAPSARSWHSAVWTGSKMIVFGGVSRGGNYPRSGGVYDPATDSWSSLNTNGAPSARRGHSAVWTGSKMIIFGGTNGRMLADGGIYDPATDSWSPLNTNDAPSSRHHHLAVWTGAEMVIMGGHNTTDRLADGVTYDPVTNMWSSLNINGAPSARSWRTGVWTGSKMVVFGGHTGGAGRINSTDVYDPATGLWSSLSINGAPAARASHSAVWTGSEMIIFGGYDGSNYLRDGGVFK